MGRKIVEYIFSFIALVIVMAVCSLPVISILVMFYMAF
jgi:hypothetical protein